MAIKNGTSWQSKIDTPERLTKNTKCLVWNSLPNIIQKELQMIGDMMFSTIYTLRQKYGKSQRQIAEELHLSKTTVNKYCRMTEEEWNTHSCRRAGRSEFAVAENFVRNRLLQKPCLRASRLYEEVLERYPEISAKQRAFRYFVKSIKEQLPQPPKRVFSIVETEPGLQIQVDLGEEKAFLTSGKYIKLYFCSFVLCHSRQTFVHCQANPYKTKDFIEAHLQAFAFFHGIAKEYVYDQTKLVALQEKYREVLFNNTFFQFANHAGFTPYVCEGYDPQSKGKVERSIQEIKQGFLYGRDFENLADIKEKLYIWLDKFNLRTHGTTGKIPQLLWEQEQELLKTIPPSLIQPQSRKADKTGLISYAGNKYSVPMAFQNRLVLIQEVENSLIISDPATTETLAEHKLSLEKNKRIINRNHYRNYSVELDELKNQTLSLISKYQPDSDIVNKLVSDNPKIARDQLRALRSLLDKYDEQTWLEAIPILNQLITLRATLIENVLKSIADQNTVHNILTSYSSATIPSSAIEADLNFYMQVLNHDQSN